MAEGALMIKPIRLNDKNCFKQTVTIIDKKPKKAKIKFEDELVPDSQILSQEEMLIGNGSFYFIETSNNLKLQSQNKQFSSTSILASSSPIQTINSDLKNKQDEAKPNIVVRVEKKVNDFNQKSQILDRNQLIVNRNDKNNQNISIPNFSKFWNELQNLKNNKAKIKPKISFSYFS